MTTARYGENTIYGTSGLTYGVFSFDTHRILTWILLVDWDNDGVFDGTNEAGRIFDMNIHTGRQNFLKSSGGFQEVDVGEFSAQLRNTDGRFDPFNTSSPLYGNIVPGRRFKLMVYDEITSTLHPVMKGRLDDIRPSYTITDDVRFIGSNGVKEMSKPASTEVFSNIRYDDAMTFLLASWEDDVNIDTTSSEAMPYWWASGKSLFDEANSIANAALGMFCIAEDGKAVYKSKVNPDSVLMTINGTDIDLDYGIRTPMLWEAIRNRIKVYIRNRVQQVNVELWRLSEVVSIPANGVRTIWAQFSYSGDEGVALSVTTPVITTDYLANSAADGSGSNLSSAVSIVITKFARTAKLVITNTGGTNFYLTLLKIRGTALVADKYTFSEDVNQDSIDEFGDFLLEVKTDWLQDANSADEHVAILLSRLSTARKFPRVQLRPNPSLQFAVRLFGLVQMSVPAKNIEGEFRIGYYKHTWRDELGQIVDTEIYLEPNLLENITGAWIFPAIFGTTTVF